MSEPERYEYFIRYWVGILGIKDNVVLRNYMTLESGSVLITVWNGSYELSSAVIPEKDSMTFDVVERLLVEFNQYVAEKAKS